MQTRLDPRLTDPRYDFRFFQGDPIAHAKRELSGAFRVANRTRCDGTHSIFSKHAISRATRMLWAARNQPAILAMANGGLV